jgi:hypothetical protein
MGSFLFRDHRGVRGVHRDLCLNYHARCLLLQELV